MEKREMLEKKAVLENELQGMLDIAKEETRGLSQEEDEQYKAKEEELRGLIEKIENVDQKLENIKEKPKMEKVEVRALEDAYVKGLATGNMEEFRALSVGAGEGLVPADNTIPEHLMTQIIKKISENSNVVAEVSKVSATGDITFFVEKKDVEAKMLLENEEITEQDVNTFDTITLKDRRLGTLTTVTKNLLLASPIVSEAYLVGKISERMAKTLEKQVLFADGTGANMGRGILSSVPAANIVTTGAVAAVSTDDIQHVITSMKPQFLGGAKFYMNRATFQTLSKLKDGNGHYFTTVDVASSTPQYKMFGFPIVITEAIVDGIATGKTPILFANMGEAMKMKIASNAQLTVLREKYATRGAIGIMSEMFADCNVVQHEAYRTLKIK